MIKMRRITKELKRTAYHEAGHFVAGWLNDELMDTISIVPDHDEGTSGRLMSEECVRYADEHQNWPEERAKAYLVGLYAGYAAQRRFDPNQPDEHARLGARSDFEEAEIWSDKFDLAALQQNAHALVAEHWPKIEQIAKALLVKEALTSEEADALIGLLASDEVQGSVVALHACHKWPLKDVQQFCRWKLPSTLRVQTSSSAQ